MKFLLTNAKGTFLATQLVSHWKWAGDKRQGVRTLHMTVISSSSDKSIPALDWATGAIIDMVLDDEVLYHGKIMNRSGSTDGHTLDFYCHDNGRHLIRNPLMIKFTSKTPEAITREVINELNQRLGLSLTIGALATTGVAITRLFLSGQDSAYDIIMTAYTIAAKTTGKKYHVGFRGRELYVTVMDKSSRTLVIKGGSNLIGAHTTESIENIVTQVDIYSQEDTFVRSITDESRRKLYDPVRKIVKQTKGDDKASEAQKLLDQGNMTQKITVDNLGNIACVTGGTVVVQEPYTGLYGLFYIDADNHEGKRGQYYNKLTLNLKNIMDEKEVGTLPNADGTKTAGSKVSPTKSKTKKKFIWKYDVITGEERK